MVELAQAAIDSQEPRAVNVCFDRANSQQLITDN